MLQIDEILQTFDSVESLILVHTIVVCTLSKAFRSKHQPIFQQKGTITVKLGFKELLNKEQICNSEPFPITNLLLYLINSEQISISERFCHDQKVPYYQV